MAKVDHSKMAWKNTKNRMGPLSNPNKKYVDPSEEQKVSGKHRRKLEDLNDEKALKSYVSEIWDE